LHSPSAPSSPLCLSATHRQMQWSAPAAFIAPAVPAHMAQSSRTGTITPITITVTAISRFKSFKPVLPTTSLARSARYGAQHEEEPLGRVLHQGFFALAI